MNFIGMVYGSAGKLMSMDLDKIESDANSAEKDIELLCSLVDNSVNTVYVCDSVTDELIYMNKAAEKLSGCHFDNQRARNAMKPS